MGVVVSKAEPQPRPKPGDTLYWSSPVAWEALPVTVGKCGRKWAEITRSAPSWSGVVACRMDLDTLTVENSSVRCYRSEAEWQADHDRIVAECRRAFLRGARAMLDELCDTEEEIGSLASLYTALARFERERC